MGEKQKKGLEKSEGRLPVLIPSIALVMARSAMKGGLRPDTKQYL